MLLFNNNSIDELYDITNDGFALVKQRIDNNSLELNLEKSLKITLFLKISGYKIV